MKKRRKWIILVVLIVGILMCCLVAYQKVIRPDGSEWQMIATPPEPAIRILAIQYNRIWIESESGKIFFNEDASSCTLDCWVEVAEVELLEGPDIPYLQYGDVIIEDVIKSKLELPPLKGVKETKSQSGTDHQVGITYSFALTEDGLIYYWVHEFWL